MLPSIPENSKLVQLAQPQTTSGGFASDAVSLKNCLRATIIVELTQGVGHATAVTLKQATDVAIGTNAAGPASRIWANEDVADTDTLAAQTAAAAYTVTNDIKNKQIVIEVDPATLTDEYSVVYVTLADSGQATNLASVTAILHERCKQATPPAAITD